MNLIIKAAMVVVVHFLLIGSSLAAGIGNYSDSWEIRLGGGAFDYGPFTEHFFSGGVVNAEVLAPSPELFDAIGSPRPYVGTDIAISSNPIHNFYGGLNWEANLTKRLYVGFSLGAAINTSPVTTNAAGQTKNLGSNLLFHLQGSIGFDVTETITVQVYLNHFSNARLSSFNDGLESVGGRVGFRF